MDNQMATVREQFTFTGKAGEYLRIWIVNVCLTIITIGLYSPWAKVRRLKYLYGSTHLAGGSFDYHASPIAILKGRLIGLVVVTIYIVVSIIVPGVEILIILVVGLFMPWLIVRSRMFQLRNTSFQNIRFSFNNVVGEAASAIFGIGLLVGISFGLAYPYYRFRRTRLIIDNSSFGNQPFKLKSVIGGFFARYVLAVIAFIAAFLILFGFIDFDAVREVLEAAEETEESDLDVDTGMQFIQFVVGAIFVSFVVFSVLRESILKLTLNNTTVGDHQLICDWSIGRLAFILVTNLLAIGLSIGLLIPWSTIRMQRYKMENMSIDVDGRLEDIVAVQSSEISAVGDELGEAFDIDLGL